MLFPFIGATPPCQYVVTLVDDPSIVNVPFIKYAVEPCVVRIDIVAACPTDNAEDKVVPELKAKFCVQFAPVDVVYNCTAPVLKYVVGVEFIAPAMTFTVSEMFATLTANVLLVPLNFAIPLIVVVLPYVLPILIAVVDPDTPFVPIFTVLVLLDATAPVAILCVLAAVPV